MRSSFSPVLALSSAGEEAVMPTTREHGARANHGDTMMNAAARARANARALGDVPSQLAELDTMNVGALAEKYRELYGEPTRSRNKDYLKKRLAWRIQELAEGGLSQSALARIQQIGDQLPERWRMRLGQPEGAPQPLADAAPVVQALEPRDPRVPPVGTVLRRVFDGKTHEVTVCAEGFEYAGRRYKSLSAVATEITGTRWNGYLFFSLRKRNAMTEECR